MLFVWTLFLVLPIFTGKRFATAQNLGELSDIQAFLNNFCPPGSTNEGCDDAAIITPSTALPPRRPVTTRPPTPRPSPTRPPSLPPASRPPVLSSDGCTDNGKRCPQLQRKCVPANFDCSLLNLGITCRVPRDYGVQTQVLICGDGTPSGVRCGLDISVPILTVLLVKCHASNEVNDNPVSALDIVSGPGDEGGAGIYECSASGTWEPRFQSPFLNTLTVSCRNAGCGGVPHPSDELPIHRRWPMVRAIYRGGRLHCSATLVAPDAAVTAAHCVTSSAVSNRPDDNLFSYELDLPGPFTNPILRVVPEDIKIHPRYSFNNGELQHDLAVVFFRLRTSYYLPTVCIADRPYRPQQGNVQMVFSLQGNQKQQALTGSTFDSPFWKSQPADWDSSCITTSTRSGGGCVDVLRVQQSQFCAGHLGTVMTPGSSGGPYLAEVSNGVKESWVLMGVLSRFSNDSSCARDHSIYGQVSDDSRWLKDCVFDKKCN